jgi:hypothetical protein
MIFPMTNVNEKKHLLHNINVDENTHYININIDGNTGDPYKIFIYYFVCNINVDENNH